jgi:predicted RNA binding protein YcfA (HicA-like mRNA interferase family)
MLRAGRQALTIWVVLLAILALVLVYLLWPPAPADKAGLGGSTPVSERDIQLVQDYGYLLTTTRGTHVEVVHASGVKVWAAFFPGVELGSETETIKSHDMVVVRSTSSVPQSQHQAPGSVPTKVAVVGLVIDSVTGLIVERMNAPAASVDHADDITVLGTPTDVIVENIDPPPVG